MALSRYPICPPHCARQKSSAAQSISKTPSTSRRATKSSVARPAEHSDFDNAAWPTLIFRFGPPHTLFDRLLVLVDSRYFLPPPWAGRYQLFASGLLPLRFSRVRRKR